MRLSVLASGSHRIFRDSRVLGRRRHAGTLILEKRPLCVRQCDAYTKWSEQIMVVDNVQVRQKRL